MKPALLRLPRIRQMLRFLSFLLLACGLLPMAQAQCPTGNVILTSQAAVNAFPRGCTVINGSLTIQTQGGPENYISDLSPLQDLQTVTSSVRISLNTPRLRTLDGLNNLTTVGGNLTISNNNFQNLSALRSLTSVSILIIGSEDDLINLDGLNNLTSVGSCLIDGNLSLTDLSGLEKITRLNRLDISRNNQLSDLSGLVSLTSVAEEMTIEDNPSLSQCAIEPICKLLAAGTSVLISNNAPGCNSVEEVQADCTPLAFTTQPPSQSVVCPGGNVEVTVSISGNGRTYQWYKDGAALSSQQSATLTLTNVQPIDTGVYSLLVRNSVSSIQSIDFTLKFDKPELSVNNNGPLTCTRLNVTLVASSTAVGTYTFTGPDGNLASNSNTTTVSRPGTYTIAFTSAAGCTNSATTTVGQTLFLAPPSLQTATGQSAVTVPQYAGTVTLLIAGCSGTATWTGSNGTTGTDTTIPVSTTQTGTFVYSATCRLGGCTSSPASATVTVTVTAPPITLRVLHQDVDNNLTNNTIKPYLQLQNDGNNAIPYGEITLRYWLTVEQFAPLTNLQVYYAQLGSSSKVKMKYVESAQPRQGALGYIEYSFDGSAGSLGAGQNSGPIQNGIGKQDWTPFNEVDDYSYANNANYTANPRITAYRNGLLIWGTEPTPVDRVQRVRAYSESKNGSSTNTISTVVQVRNEGNVPVLYGQLTVRYWFTSEGSQPLNFYLDYAQLGNAKVKGKLVRLSSPVTGADSYLELSFATVDRLYPLSSTNDIQYRIAKSDWSNFNQGNDYSYRASGPLGENPRMTIYLDGQLIYGQAPGGAGARIGAEALEIPLEVVVLGNPVVGETVELEVRGSAGQPLQARLVNSQGRLVGSQQRASAEAVERLSLWVGGQSACVLVLQVSTPTQQRTLKLLKP